VTDERSELFLSCDLVGSTAFKQQQDARWEDSFLAFYRQFPETLGEFAAASGVEFKLWKPIGDELVYRVRVSRESDVAAAVYTWIDAMTRYETEGLAKVPLGTKGGAFVGTFPGPDVEASVPRDPLTERSVGGLVELNDAALAERNHETNVFDYFGPSFDTGFRVIGQCNPRHFTLSVEVAFALLRAGVDRKDHMARLVYLGERELKGVWGGRNYPLFAIDRMYDDPINAVLRKLDGESDGSQQRWRDLCELCLKEPGWPSRLYLPESNLPILNARPSDALNELRRPNEMIGTEAKPSPAEESTGKRKLPDDVPIPPRRLLTELGASRRLGIARAELRRLLDEGGPMPYKTVKHKGDDVRVFRTDDLDAWWSATGQGRKGSG
jgi:hypothetical protein